MQKQITPALDFARMIKSSPALDDDAWIDVGFGKFLQYRG